MSRVPSFLFAAALTLALPVLIALVGLPATSGAPFAVAAAQDAATQPQAGERSGRRRGRRGRERAEKPAKADSAEKSEKAPALPPGMQKAAPVATFGDWNVFTSGQGKGRLCYAIAQPTTRVPKSLARDTGYLFVTVRKGENVQNEIAVMFGFKPKPAASQNKPGAAAAPSDPYLSVGSARYGLVVKDENAWVQNQSEEAKIVAEMSKTQTAAVKTTSGRGNQTNDEYALGGFADAVKRAREECK